MSAAWRTLRDGAAPGQLGARLAACELDLRERDAEIQRLRREYGLQREQGERREAVAAAVGLEALAKPLAPLLSQLATMQALAAEGRAVRLEDALKLFGKVEQVLAGAGLAPIGRVGEETRFDGQVHQRMSGAEVDEGQPIKVRFVGYRLGETVLLKAMVSRRDGAADPA
jgi:molecular chaperone GrpE